VGLVERVTFHNTENGFCVLRIKACGNRKLVTVVGQAAVIGTGEWVTAVGRKTGAGCWRHGLRHHRNTARSPAGRLAREALPHSVPSTQCRNLVIADTTGDKRDSAKMTHKRSGLKIRHLTTLAALMKCFDSMFVSSEFRIVCMAV
jgi:hypothetical protein